MTVSAALKWEEQALRDVLIDRTPRILVWEPTEDAMVLPASKQWSPTPQLKRHMLAHGWQLEQRKTGGSPVPQTSGVLNFSAVYPWPEDIQFSTHKSYQLLISILEQWLSKYGISAQVGEVDAAYCNGAYNLSLQNKKFIGTAQRIRRTSDVNGSRNVGILAHAFILINPNISSLVDAVNRCYQQSGQCGSFTRAAMTSLIEANNDLEITTHEFAAELHQSALSMIDKILQHHSTNSG